MTNYTNGNSSNYSSNINETDVWTLQTFRESPWIIPLTIIIFLLAIICIIFNSFTVLFYKKKSHDTIPLMYTALSSCDCLTGFAALLNCLVMISILLGPSAEGLLWYLVPLTALLTSTTSHVAAFYNTVLVVARSIKMVLPFHSLQNRTLKTAFVIYPVIWVIIVGFELYYYLKHSTSIIPVLQALTFMPAVGGVLISFVDHNGVLSYLILCYGIPYVIPAIICVICFFIQAAVLLRNRRERVSSNAEKVNFRITITILQLTALFFICNTVYLLMIIFVILPSRWSWKNEFVTTCYRSYLVSVVLPFINSALNPVILLLRGRELKMFVKSKFVGRHMMMITSMFTVPEHPITEMELNV